MESLFSATDLCLLLNLHPLNLSIGVLRYKFKYLYFDLVLKYLKLLEMLKKKKDIYQCILNCHRNAGNFFFYYLWHYS